MERRSNCIISTNYFHLAQFRWNYCHDLLKMWKSESIPFQRQDCRSRIGRALIVCISASEGSWNLIIVNHIQGSSTTRWGWAVARAGGSAHAGLREGGARGVQGRGDPGSPRPAESGLQVSYRDCHSFTITNAGLSETATCKWCMSGWQPANPSSPCSQESHFIVEVIGMLTWIHAIYY